MTDAHALPIGGPLLWSLSKNWWLVFLRGVAAIAFGILAFIWPSHTLLALIYICAAYALVDGIFSLVTAVSGDSSGMLQRMWLALVGVVGVLAGLVAFAWPRLPILILLLLIASWAIVSGVLELVGAVLLHKEFKNEWWLLINALLAIAFGVIVFVHPSTGARVFVRIIGVYAILAGGSLIGLAFRLRAVKAPA